MAQILLLVRIVQNDFLNEGDEGPSRSIMGPGGKKSGLGTSFTYLSVLNSIKKLGGTSQIRK